jgi:hypothetical protein
MRQTGRVLRTVASGRGGFGFLRSDGQEFFFHSADVGNVLPRVGSRVTFEAAPPDKPGLEPRARDVEILGTNDEMAALLPVQNWTGSSAMGCAVHRRTEETTANGATEGPNRDASEHTNEGEHAGG